MPESGRVQTTGGVPTPAAPKPAFLPDHGRVRAVSRTASAPCHGQSHLDGAADGTQVLAQGQRRRLLALGEVGVDVQLSVQRDTGNDPLGLDAARVLAAFVLVSVALAVTGLWEPRTRSNWSGTPLWAGGRCRDTERSAAGVGASVRVRRGRLHRRAETAGCRHRVVDLPMQPWTTTQATWIAVAVFVTGAVLYAESGRGLPRPPEHSSG